MDRRRDVRLVLGLLVGLLATVGPAGCGSDHPQSTGTDVSDDAGTSVDSGDVTLQDGNERGYDAADTEGDDADGAGGDAPIGIDVAFPGGSLDVEATSISGTRIRLQGRESFYEGSWKWFYFRVSNVAGEQPSFEIDLDFAGEVSALADHRVVYSADRETWQHFGRNELDRDRGLYRFGPQKPFERETVFVAFGIPYMPGRVKSLVSAIRDRAWVQPTPSADSSFSLGSSPSGTDDLGRTIESRRIPALQITAPDVDTPKVDVVLTAGVHANEPTGNHVLDGLVRFLAGDSEVAAQLRREARFLVYPMVNPSGYLAGHDRGTLSDAALDTNRIWSDGSLQQSSQVERVAEAIRADSDGDIEYLLDFHAAVGSGSMYAYLDEDADPTAIEMQRDPFWRALGRETAVSARDASLGFDTAMKFGWRALDAEFVATFEPYHRPAWSISDYRTFGESIGRAFANGHNPAGGPRLSMAFDSGSLDVANSSIDGNSVHLAGRDNYNSGHWKWIFFRFDNVAGRQFEFDIGLNFASGPGRLRDHEMVYSYDRTSWQFFDRNVYDGSGDAFRFGESHPFRSDRVWIAYGLPYPFGRVKRLVQQVSASSWVAPTQSADQDLVVGRSAGGTDDLGRSIPPHDLYGFRITDSGASRDKKKVVLTGGVHANETHGNHTLHGLVQWLVGDSTRAKKLRKHATVYVYPMVNPDGRYAGYNRSTVQASGEDPNRQWSSANWGNNKEIRTIAKAMQTDTGGDVDYVLDFHSRVGTGSHFAYLDIDENPTGISMEESTFWQSLTGREPLAEKDGSYIGRTCMRFGWAELNAEFSSTVETQFPPDQHIERYLELGRNVGRSLHDAIVP